MENTDKAESPACNFIESSRNIESTSGEISSNVLPQNYHCAAGNIEKLSKNIEADKEHNLDNVFKKENEKNIIKEKSPVKKNVTFQISPVPQDNTIEDLKRMNSSEYVALASSMREKIEKKITEIEEKIDLPVPDLNQECIETESR